MAVTVLDDITTLNAYNMGVVLGGDSTGYVLGYCAPGDITVAITHNWVDQTVAQYGSTPIEAYFTGYNVTVEASFAQVEDFDLWEQIFQLGEKNTFSGVDRFTGHTVASGLTVGTKASSIAQQLTLRPWEAGTTTTRLDTETNSDFTVVKAYTRDVAPLVFSLETPQEIRVTWHALHNESATEGEDVWFKGLLTGTWT